MNFLGIDLSLTGTGLALLEPPEPSTNDVPGFFGANFQSYNGNRVWSMIINTKDINGHDRWRMILETVGSWVRHAEAVVMEGYSYGSPQRMRECMEIGGIIKFHLMEELHRIPIIIQPMTLKKFVTGSGKGDKNLMLMHTFKRYGLEFSNDNECDAFGLAKIGQALELGTEGLPQFQVDIIEALKAGPKPKKRKVHV